MTSDTQSILIFGGTFDPPHLAHAQLPPLAAERLGCEKILYIPASINPLKADAPPTPAAHRLAMLKLITCDLSRVNVETLELDRKGPSYMVDTLKELRERFGEKTHLHLLIGADQALEFHRWKDWQRILELATPAVMLRPPIDAETFQKQLSERYEPDEAAFWKGHLVEVPYLDINSSAVRLRVDRGDDLGDLLDGRIIEYIREHGLYS